MICVFCQCHVDEREEAIEAGWWPDFYTGEINYEGPVCVVCTGRFIVMGEAGVMELRPGVDVPPLAIPLRRRPNLR